MLRKYNRFLADLGPDLALIQPRLREVTLRAGQVLSEPGEEIRQVHFLHEGMVSKLIVFEDGTQIESALVGREGAVGAIAVLGLRTALTRDVCHLAGRAAVLDASSLLGAYQQSQRIHDAFHRYCAWKMSCAIRNGACNAQHSVEQRLGRWLLTCSDVLEESEIRLSQEVFAHMLGVQRSSVNTILQKFRSEGLICLERARLKIVDHRRLQAQACECYGAMKAAEDQLLGLHPPIRSA